jgi:hypothetical protein
MGMDGTAAHGNAPPQPPSVSVLTLRPTTPRPDKRVVKIADEREAAELATLKRLKLSRAEAARISS